MLIHIDFIYFFVVLLLCENDILILLDFEQKCGTHFYSEIASSNGLNNGFVEVLSYLAYFTHNDVICGFLAAFFYCTWYQFGKFLDLKTSVYKYK